MRPSVRQDVVDWEAASTGCRAAVVHAEETGVRINVAVVDAGGNLAAFLRMPGAFLLSIDIAVDKAYIAAGFGLPTGAWSEALQSHSAAVREGLVLRPRMVCFGGGLPLVHEGQRIGGIGVSGGFEAQDQGCAQAGLSAMGLDPGEN